MQPDPDLTARMIRQAALACLALAFWYMLTACSPYAAQPQPGTATPSPTVTATATSARLINSPTPAPLRCTVTTGYPEGTVNFRKGPGTSAEVIGILHEGQALTVIGDRGAWLKVTTRNRAGYIYSKYCQ